MLKTLSLQFLFGGLLSLITITNPLSKIPLFITLTREMTDSARDNQARRACVFAAAIMVVSLLAGNVIMSAFGISYGALRISGGFVVAVLGYRMLFLSQDPGNAPKTGEREDYAFFPLAMPGISGPGTIAVVIGISTEIAELTTLPAKALAFAMTFAAIGGTCFGMWLTLKSSQLIAQRLGRGGREVMTRLMGFLLICIGVQFVGSGIRTFMAGS
ncbi:MarC family NAAT transporter [Chromobacterium haemolyticum]|uniref:MarC family NAAT transporter n=1 Tax=Chromobacterium haemolyticum TaxID=394935 RepID=UPI002448B460|nr:MarC family NAAT transporter [Chromobacterium haemolyticum]MDH0344537.1 MarC family NAAT transporter [Chromobacterium haemolyticum]